VYDVRHPHPTPPDCDSLTSNDDRCKALRIRQEKAAQFMRKNGIKSLLAGRAAWRRINPMHTPEPVSRVVQMKRRKT
jgi:hypothetical protein